MSRPKKNVVLFLIEGASEIDALSGPLWALMDEYHYQDNVEVFFGYIKEKDRKSEEDREGGDITSKYGVDPTCVVKIINKLMLSWVFNTQHLYPKDITEVIQLTDLDGVYIPNSNIKLELANDEASYLYTDNSIVVRDLDKAIERNERKRANIDYLVSLSEIEIFQGSKRKVVPYSIYYFSSNLDHYLHNNANIEASWEKRSKAQAFSVKSVDDKDYFINTFLCDSDSTSDLGYKESWDFIREGINSLGRHSNLGILIKKIIGQ